MAEILLGYTVHKGKLTINDEEAPIIREIFHKYTNEEGKGTHIIARELTQQGDQPRRLALDIAIVGVCATNENYDNILQKTFTVSDT
ncbi:MAG: hypothetical protein V8S22_09455 [Lachnospiraceae bacterium]